MCTDFLIYYQRVNMNISRLVQSIFAQISWRLVGILLWTCGVLGEMLIIICVSWQLLFDLHFGYSFHMEKSFCRPNYISYIVMWTKIVYFVLCNQRYHFRHGMTILLQRSRTVTISELNSVYLFSVLCVMYTSNFCL